MTTRRVLETEKSTRPEQRTLTWGYSLVVVVTAFVAVAILRFGLGGISTIWRQQIDSASPVPGLAGIRVAQLMVGISQLATLLVLLIGVPLGLRRREGGRRFAFVFAAMLVLLLVVVLARFGFWAALEFPYVLGAQFGFFLFLAVPLFWVLPAYIASLIRLRVAILIVAIGLIAALTTWGVSAHH